MAASIDSLAPFVEELIFKFDVGVTHSKDHFCFHLDYEQKTYREDELVRLIRDSVEYFALTHEEFERFRAEGNLVEARRVAWSRISTARKDKKGDYGELLLFLLLTHRMPERIPRFVTKVRLRSSRGDQIKGFDCAHCTLENGTLFLWLGEAKFHQNMSGAIGSALGSLTEHWQAEYLTNEIRILAANIEANHGLDQSILEELSRALSKGRSIDRLHFKIPILLTYDSKTISDHSTICNAFKQALKAEFDNHFKSLSTKFTGAPPNFSLLFLLMPLARVAEIKSKLEIIEGALK